MAYSHAFWIDGDVRNHKWYEQGGNVCIAKEGSGR
jgi:hypothetical protein